jgi:hypothetical protein
VRRIDAADGGNDTLIATIGGSALLHGMAIDRANDKIYVAAFTAGKIIQMDLDGSNQTDWKTGLSNPIGVAIHNGRVYWTENVGDTVKSDVFAKGSETTHIDAADGITDPRFLHVTDDWIYLAEGTATANGEVGRWSHDGVTEENLDSFGTGNGNGVYGDEANGFCYNADDAGGANTVNRVPLAGGTNPSVITLSSGDISGFKVDEIGGHFYIAAFDATTGVIARMDKDNIPSSDPAELDWEVEIDNVRDVDWY